MALNSTIAAATMRLVAWAGQVNNVSVIDVPIPTINNQTDAIVRVTSSAICGSDMHFYHGYTGADNMPWGLGHEAVGYVESVCSSVSSLTVGEYVIIPDNAHDGHYGQEHPLSFGSGNENYGGLQAEYARVPLADMSLIPIPYDNQTGLLAAYSALLRGASRVYSVDQVPDRLRLAESIGAIPIMFNASDPFEQSLAQEPSGVTRALDCVGFESVNATGARTDGLIPRQLMGVTAQQGSIAIAGVYTGGQNSTRGAPNAGTVPATVPISVFELWSKALTVTSGIVLPLEHAHSLVNLAANGRASPSFVVSSVIDIEQVPESYCRYSEHLEHKVVIRFP
ncbi:alcohol dehydrogenase [Penicillium malachiteum]|nr:alcohol dehydrogenase [Penicillium malachiteum]